MLSGNLIQSSVAAFDSYVTINGVTHAHKSWSVRRRLTNDLPDQVVAGAGIDQATGTIVWPAPKPVNTMSVNPWNPASGWLPQSGDRVVIWAGDGTTYWKQFTGVIDEVEADVGGVPSSTIIDDRDKLKARFSHDALLRIMPPRENGGVRRVPSLSYTYYVDACLRRAGFYITPPLENRPCISVPAQGSMWPERGVLTEATAQPGSPFSGATFVPSPWGYSASDCHVTYVPRLQFPPTEPVELTVMVAPDHNGNYFQTCYYGNNSISLSVAGSKTVTGRYNGSFVGSFAMGNATMVSLVVRDGTWTFRTNTGTTITRTRAVATSPTMDKVVIDADANARVSGMQVCHPSPSTEFRLLSYTQTAVMDNNSALASLMDAAPVIKPTEAGDVLHEIGGAVLSAMWIDESGMFRVVPIDVLLNTPPNPQPVTTLKDIRSLSWTRSLLGVRSTVEVDYRRPLVDVGIYSSKLLKQGSMVTLSSGESLSELISPGSDEDWIEPDLAFQVLGAVGASFASNAGRGSITGAVLTDGDTEEIADNYLTATLEQIAPGTLRVTHKAKTLPAGKELELRYPSASTTIWKRWLKESFYFIRSFARVDWVDTTVVSDIVGPPSAPPLVHDTGPWLAREDNTIVVDRVARLLAQQLVAPAAVITQMAVRYDPRRQLGDVITIESPNLLGVTLNALIFEIENSADGSYTQSLGVRIISASSNYTTFGEFIEAHPDTLTFAQWQLLFPSTATFGTFNSDPLRGS